MIKKRMNKDIVETNFELPKQWKGSYFVDDDILLLDQLDTAPFPNEPRRMSFILICLCTNGGGKFRLDGQEHTIGEGDILVISERHVIDKLDFVSNLSGLCMMVSMSFYNEIIREVSDISALFLFAHNHPVFALSKRDQKVFNEYYHVIQSKIIEVGNRYRRDLVRTLMLALFYDLSNLVYHYQLDNTIKQSRCDIIFTQFIKMVEEHCREQRRVSWYAHELRITPKYLSEMVKIASKRSPNEWIDSYVTSEIRILLKHSTMNIKEIAETMNFPNQSFLGKFFKEHTGMSPTDYRKS